MYGSNPSTFRNPNDSNSLEHGFCGINKKLGTGRSGAGGGGGGGEREIIYLSLHCHHQNDSCIKMGSNKSHFDVSLIVINFHTAPELWLEHSKHGA